MAQSITAPWPEFRSRDYIEALIAKDLDVPTESVDFEEVPEHDVEDSEGVVYHSGRCLRGTIKTDG